MLPSSRGGARPGAGRPSGTGRYGEPTCPIRVPCRLLPAVEQWLAGLAHADQADLYLPAETPPPLALRLYATRIAAGFPSPADDYVEGRLDLNQHLIKHPAATFFVRVTGDSMLGAGIHPGDMLIVDRAVKPTHGKVVIAVIDGELTVKRLYRHSGQVELRAENAQFPPISLNDAMEVQIWGVVTSVIHPL